MVTPTSCQTALVFWQCDLCNICITCNMDVCMQMGFGTEVSSGGMSSI